MCFVRPAASILNRLWLTFRSGGSGYVRSVSNYSIHDSRRLSRNFPVILPIIPMA
jgi:hypothetical protein